MHLRSNLVFLTLALAVCMATPVRAAFTSAGLTVSGDSRVGLASAFADNPTGFTSQTATDVDSVQGAGGPVPGPTGADTFNTGVQVGQVSFDQRRASTTGRAEGTPDLDATLTMVPTAFANVLNRPVTSSQYKGTAISAVTFVGEFLAANTPGVAISYSGTYSMRAFAQNNAPGGYNNNSAFSSVYASLLLENVTAGTTAGQSAFIDDAISQKYCGSTGSCFPTDSLDNNVSGTVYVPISGYSPGDTLRMTITVRAATDTYAKGFLDTAGYPQTAGGYGFSRFDSMGVKLLLIPEPASLVLLLVGAACIGAARRQTRRLAIQGDGGNASR